jgi:hypothetical protein
VEIPSCGFEYLVIHTPLAYTGYCLTMLVSQRK